MTEKRCRLCGRGYANWPAHMEECRGEPMTARTPEQHAEPQGIGDLFVPIPPGVCPSCGNDQADTERLREALREIATATVPAASAHALRFRRIARAALASPPADDAEKSVRVIPPYPHPWWRDVQTGDRVRLADEDRVYRVLEATPDGATLCDDHGREGKFPQSASPPTDTELCDYVPTPDMVAEPKPVACPKCGHEWPNDGPITYSGCLSCEPAAARAAGARPPADTEQPT